MPKSLKHAIATAIVTLSVVALSSCSELSNSRAAAAPLSPSRPALQIAPQAAIDKSGWWLHLCKKHTDSNSVELAAGVDDTDKDASVWQQTSDEDVDINAKYRNIATLWFRGRASDQRVAYICVNWQNATRAVVEFRRQEIRVVKAADTATCDCAP